MLRVSYLLFSCGYTLRQGRLVLVDGEKNKAGGMGGCRLAKKWRTNGEKTARR